ncbi:MAG: hypothetical protein WKF81_03030, partial [Thermomicrobiales bacterium]
ELTMEEWAAVHPVFEAERPALTGLESTQARDVAGGTAPSRVRQALEEANIAAGAERVWFTGWASRHAALFDRT